MKSLCKASKRSVAGAGLRRVRSLAVGVVGVLLVCAVTAVVTGGSPSQPSNPAAGESPPLQYYPVTAYVTGRVQPASIESPSNLVPAPQLPGPQPTPAAAPGRANAYLQPVPDRVAASAPAQGLPLAAPYPICGVDSVDAYSACRWGGGETSWEDARLIAWQAYAQGEYVGHPRTAHVPEYRLRVDDQLDMLYRITRDETRAPYRLNVGDEVRIESFADPELTRSVSLLPDGTITLRLLGQVHAAGRTVTQLRDALDTLYKKYYKVPSITVTATKFNTQIDDLRAVVDRHYGVGGQGANVRVTPDGTISLTAIGHVRAQGLSLDELQQEINERYRVKYDGIEILPVLVARAPRYVYVLGEVRAPGRFEMTGPTTALQALAMAGSWNVGANISQIVVFRRGDDWRLMATMVDLQGALRGKQPCPKGEIWLSDSDVIIVPKSRILEADDFINLVFTHGLFGVFPMQTQISFAKLSTI